jgi:hypothetical protein
MTVGALPRRHRKVEADAVYRERMLVNALTASFITLMIITGFWIVNTVVQVS